MLVRWSLCFFAASWWLSSIQAFSPAVTDFRSNAATHQLRMSKSFQEEPDNCVPSSILITFDLDDTLFPIKPVVQEANDAQINAMHNLGYTQVTMEQCMVQTRAIRQALTSPITYTDLRKGAIRAEIQRIAPSIDQPILDQQVEHCFDAWLEERHAAAERHLFPDAIGAMKDLQTSFGEKESNLCIAGITNGRGNPLCMPNTLAPFFSFCVSGEDDDVFPHRKPAPQIFEAALKRWRSLQTDSDYDIPDLWFHVGDCLANDVGASHDVGALPIWVAPEEEDETDEQPSWSTATEKDLKERAILMEAARAKVKGKITSLSQLTAVMDGLVKNWNPEDIRVAEEASAYNR